MKRLASLLIGTIGKTLDVEHAAYPVPVALWPDAITVAARKAACGNGVTASFVLIDYPGEVPPAWLEPLIASVPHVDVSIHIEPVDTAAAAARLKRRRARLESSRRYEANKDKLDDPYVEAAARDAADLAGRLASGTTRMFTTAVYATVHAPDQATLVEACGQLRAAATSAMLDLRPASFRQLPAITSTLPLGVDALGARRTVDTDVAAAAFPFCTPDAPATDTGVLYGLNAFTGSPVIWDRWACDNHNSVVVARSGAGKSYFTKTEILRQLFDGANVAVIDPDGEYTALAAHVGGQAIGVGSVHMNPLALPAEPGGDALTRRIMFAHTLVAALLDDDLEPEQTRALDDAVAAAYLGAGITADQATWGRIAPQLSDVLSMLETTEVGRTIASPLAPFVSGGLSGLFTGDPQDVPAGHLVVYNLKDLPEELISAGTLLVLDAIWRSLRDDGKRRLIVVDEAWLLLRQGAGATFLSRLAKSARKRRAGLMTVTQDAEDMLGSALGRTVIANAATQILLRQAPQSLDTVAGAFHLTAAEAQLLATAGRGEALLLSGDTHVAFHATASPDEHELLITGIEEVRP